MNLNDDVVYRCRRLGPLYQRHPGRSRSLWFGCEDTEQTAALVTDVVTRRIPARFGLDPRRDVQVLCPMHRGPAGAGNLNLLLQDALTPSTQGQPERRYGGRVFRVGDKVTQLRFTAEYRMPTPPASSPASASRSPCTAAAPSAPSAPSAPVG